MLALEDVIVSMRNYGKRKMISFAAQRPKRQIRDDRRSRSRIAITEMKNFFQAPDDGNQDWEVLETVLIPTFLLRGAISA